MQLFEANGSMTLAHPSNHPFASTIGLHFSAPPGAGRSLCWLEVEEHLRNPHGVLHGGVIFSMADTGMGAALYSLLAPDETTTTIEIKINYLQAVTQGRIECATRTIDKGAFIGVLESEIRNGNALVATALGTFAIVKRK
jgi:acyl-CoA thioesterase